MILVPLPERVSELINRVLGVLIPLMAVAQLVPLPGRPTGPTLQVHVGMGTVILVPNTVRKVNIQFAGNTP